MNAENDDDDTRGNWTTRGLPTRGLDISRTGQLADVAGYSCSFK